MPSNYSAAPGPIGTVSTKHPNIAADFISLKIIVKRPFQDISKVFFYNLDGSYLCEGYSQIELGLYDSGITEQNLAAQKRINRQLNKATRAYEEALAHEKVMRKTLEHRQPLKMPAQQRVAAGVEGCCTAPARRASD